jgi:Flp pilus assembly protein protease CpaA
VFETLSGWPGWTVPLVVGYAAFLIGISVYDMRRHRIPNVAVYPAVLVALGFAFVRPDGPWWTFLLSGLGAAAFFIVLGTVSAGGMGMGDAKLAALIGLVAGWPAVLVAIFVAFALGAIAATRCRSPRRSPSAPPRPRSRDGNWPASSGPGWPDGRSAHPHRILRPR